MVIWMIGLSGSGKTTLGREIYNQWRQQAPNTVFIDGDEIRDIFKHDRGDAPYTMEGRRQNAERITALCEMLDKQDINVVCCILSVFQDMREENRTRFKNYFEVFMDAPIEVLQKRDVKGLYAKAAKGEMKNVIGIDLPFERPVGSDMVIVSDTDTPDIQALAHEVLVQAGCVE